MTRQLETKKTKFRRIKSNVLDDHSLISISKDTDAQYVINSKNFANIKQATFFDRNEKIFEISNQQDNITLNIFTSKPLNIFGNIDANIILIQSLGKLQFNGQINTKYLNIDAKAVDFEQLVNCSGGANINVKDDLIFKEKLKGGFLNCSAENIFLKRQITAQDDINLLARKVIDIKEGLRSRGKINLKSDDIALYGVFIAKKVTLVAQKKIENNANIQVVKNIKIKAVDIKHNGRIYSYGECHIKARQNLFCTKNSKIEVSKHFTARAIASGLYGYLNVKQGCEIKAQSLDTDNAIYCTGYIHINVIEWYCYQGSNINIQHTDPLEKSNIAVKNIFLSEYGSHIHAYAAPLIIELFQKQQLKSLPLTFSAKRLEANGKFLLEYAMILGERLIVKEKAAIAINRAWFQVEFIVVDGEFSCQHSQLDATRVAYEKNSTTQCQYVDINVNNEFLVDGSAALINSAVEAKYTEFSGDLLLVNVGVKSKDAIFYPYSVKGEQLSIDTEQLGLHSNPNKKWTFKNLIANTKVLEVEGDCTLIESKINVHDNKVSSNNGRLHLHDSFIITDGHFFNNKNAKLIVTQSKPSSEIQQQANVDTKQIYNQGDIQITAATLKSEIIIHVGNKFKAIQSTIDVSKDLSIDEQAKLSLTEHSFLTGNPELLLRKATLTLKKGSQLEANKIFAASGSKAKFDESYAKVKDKLLIQDKLKIKNSVLTAKQLDLMKAGQINTNAALIEVENTRLVGELAAKKTQLNIGENILVCPDGQMKLTSTHLQGKEMEFQGHLHVAAVPRNVSIVYPENNQEFDQQVAEWKNGHGVDDILFIFSPELKIWNAVQIQKDKELNKTEIQSDSPFFSELQHITRKNVATYDKKQIQLMLANTVTFKLKKLKTTFESTIEGDSLSTLTDYWTHEGQLRLTERWYGRGKQLLVDEGNIQTGERIDSGFDSFFNSGSLSTKHMSNKAGLLINLGWMRADFMNNASFLCLNGGVMNAYHLQNNALVQFNYGLMLPSLPTNPRELLSKNTLKIFGKSVLCSVAPQLSSAINFAFALPDACSFAKTAWENLSFEKLEETGKKLKEMPIYELADHACQVNNFLTSTINFGLRAKSAIDNWEEHWQNGVQTYNAVKQTNFSSLKSNLSTAASSISFDKIMNVSKQGAKIGASVIGPTCSNNSFYSSNNGVTFSHNVHESSFFYSNNSFEAALDSITVNSAFQYNQGNISTGYGSVNLAGYSFTNDGYVSGGNGVVANFNNIKLTNASQSDYCNWYVRTDSFSVSGTHSFIDSKIKSRELNAYKIHEGNELTFDGESTTVDVHIANIDVKTNVEKASFFTDILQQHEDVTVKNKGNISIKEEHIINGSNYTVADESTSLVNSERLVNGAKVIIENKSIHKVKKQLEMERNTELIAKGHSWIDCEQVDQAGAITVEDHALFSIRTLKEREGSAIRVKATEEAALLIQESVQKSAMFQQEVNFQETQLNENIEIQLIENGKKQQKKEQSESQIEHVKKDLEKNKVEQSQEKSSQKLLKLRNDAKNLRKELNELETQKKLISSELEQDRQRQENDNELLKQKIKDLHQQIKVEQTELEKVNSRLVCEEAELAGSLDISDNAVVDIKNIQMKKTANLTGNNNSIVNAILIQSEGKVTLDESQINAEKQITFSETATNSLNNSSISAANIDDASQLKYSGESSLNVGGHYNHTGYLQENTDKIATHILYIQTKTAQLAGKGEIDSIFLNIDHLHGDINDFALGRKVYHDYKINKNITLVTKDDIDLNGDNERACNLALTGKKVNSNVNFSGQYSVKLKSTQDDVSIKNNINLRNFVVDSAKDVHNHCKNITVKQGVKIFANGENNGNVYNIHSNINGSEVIINGGYVKNDETDISGKNYTIITATHGDVDNYYNSIHGGDYCQISALKKVHFACKETEFTGKYDTEKRFTPVMITGGAGVNNYGIGVAITAGEKVILDASRIESTGDNYIKGNAGVEFKERKHEYIANKYTKKGFLGFNKKNIVEKSTQIQAPQILSKQGRNTIVSKTGSVNAVATQFISSEGTTVNADKDINLLSSKYNNKIYEEKSYFWGLINMGGKWHNQEGIFPTVFFDNGATSIHSENGSVDAKDALFLGHGSLAITAKKNIFLNREVLKHTFYEKDKSINPLFFGKNAYDVYQQGGNIWQMLTAEDPTLANMDALGNSNTPAAAVANACNLGINVFNTTHSLFRGLNNNHLGEELMQRYALGCTSGFDPSLTLSFSMNEAKGTYQTVGPGGIYRTHVTLKANKIEINNGYEIAANGDAVVYAKEVKANAAELESETDAQRNNVDVSMTASGHANVGMSHSESHVKNKIHKNVLITVAGNLDVEIDKLTASGVNIETNTISGHIQEASLGSLQDHHESDSMHYSINTSGIVSFGMSHQESSKVTQPTSIHVKEDINKNEKKFEIDQLHLKGAKVTSDGSISPFANSITEETIKDYEYSRGIHISTNVFDLTRLFDDSQSQENYTGPAIPNSRVNYEHVDVQAIQQSTVYGPKGIHSDIERENGLNTKNWRGYQIIRERKENIHLDVPHINRHRIDQAKNNIVDGLINLFPSTIAKPASSILPTQIDSFENINDVEDKREIVSCLSLDDFPHLEIVDEELNTLSKPIDIGDCKMSFSDLNSESSLLTIDNLNELQLQIDDDDQLIRLENLPFEEKIKRHGIKTDFEQDLNLSSINFWFKNNRAGQKQLFIRKDGKYSSVKDVLKKITEENKGRKRISGESKIEFKYDLFEGHEQVYWRGESLYEDDNNTIQPVIVDDGGYFSFTANMGNNNPGAIYQLMAGRTLRLNIAEGNNNFYIGDLQFAVDACTSYFLLKATASNQDKINIELSAEAGILGPTAKIGFKSTQISCLGFMMEWEALVQFGTGLGGVIGAGASIDTTLLKLKSFAKAGLYAGPAIRGESKLAVGIDTDIKKRFHIACEEGIERRQKVWNDIHECIEEAKNRKTTSTWELIKKWWDWSCYMECLDDIYESIGTEATARVIAPQITTKQPSIPSSQPNKPVLPSGPLSVSTSNFSLFAAHQQPANKMEHLEQLSDSSSEQSPDETSLEKMNSQNKLIPFHNPDLTERAKQKLFTIPNKVPTTLIDDDTPKRSCR